MKFIFLRNIDAYFLKKTRWLHHSLIVKLLAKTGSFGMTGLLLTAIFFLPSSECRIAAITGLCASILDTIIVLAIKYIVRRKRCVRPSGLKYRYDPYSFPSGHVSRLSALAACTLIITYPIGLIITLIISILTVACWVCRQRLRFHYFTDCLAGCIVGIICGIVCILGVRLSIIPAYYILYILNML